tara:strand:- start:3575 stop:3709 length:135 start_codon:yes stop_codon:yes gene_type:complete
MSSKGIEIIEPFFCKTAPTLGFKTSSFLRITSIIELLLLNKFFF